MTCIVGLVQDGTVYLAGDSAALNGWDLTLLADRKVFQVGEVVLGGTGSTRMLDLLRYRLSPPPVDGAVRRWVAVEFIDAVRAAFRDGGFAQKDQEREQYGGAFLVGVRGRLFTVDSSFGVDEARIPYAACGCGDSFALGALYATAGQRPAARLRQALAAAEAFSAGVRGPFTVVILPPAEAGREAVAPPPACA